MRALRQRHQRQRAALAVVVGAQQDHDVFERDDDDQRPEDQRQHAEHRVSLGALPAPTAADDRFAQRVERARADVAVDDADAAERQRPEAALRAFAVAGGDASPARGASVSWDVVGSDRSYCCTATIWTALYSTRRPLSQRSRAIDARRSQPCQERSTADKSQ